MHSEDLKAFKKELSKFIKYNADYIKDVEIETEFDNIVFDVQVAIDRAEDAETPDSARIGYYFEPRFTGGQY